MRCGGTAGGSLMYSSGSYAGAPRARARPRPPAPRTSFRETRAREPSPAVAQPGAQRMHTGD